ncbi:MAG: hypothetical protein Q3977_04045 [Oscillospiraceae bacterium]|nr:hypothetical protein [Oscillospiraceae bacterium]
MGQISGLPSFSEAEIRKVLGTPEGRSLLQMLREDRSNTLQKAADALKAGDAERAQALLRPMMETPAVAELIRKINGR